MPNTAASTREMPSLKRITDTASSARPSRCPGPARRRRSLLARQRVATAAAQETVVAGTALEAIRRGVAGQDVRVLGARHMLEPGHDIRPETRGLARAEVDADAARRGRKVDRVAARAAAVDAVVAGIGEHEVAAAPGGDRVVAAEA